MEQCRGLSWDLSCLTTSSITWRRHQNVYTSGLQPSPAHEHEEWSFSFNKREYILKVPDVEAAVLTCFKLFILCLISFPAFPCPYNLLNWLGFACTSFIFSAFAAFSPGPNPPLVPIPLPVPLLPTPPLPARLSLKYLCFLLLPLFLSCNQETAESTRQGRPWVYPPWEAQYFVPGTVPHRCCSFSLARAWCTWSSQRCWCWPVTNTWKWCFWDTSKLRLGWFSQG